MEFCEAGSIKDIMHVAQTSLEENQIAYIVRQALIGLDYLHQKRIIHRDIKAANILMNFEGNIKIGMHTYSLCQFFHFTTILN
jgi:serine/threonine protein kinase